MYQPCLSLCSYRGWRVIDRLSSCLVVLTLWVVSLCFLARHSRGVAWTRSTVRFTSLMLFMVGVLVVCFSRGVIPLFYVSFELVLVPMLYLILGWGYQPERLQARMYMMLYTVGASLPLLAGLVYVYWSGGSLHFLVLPGGFSLRGLVGVWEMVFFLAFLVKLPMFCFHLWLPKAHVEAPVAGSMVLAGVLLKMGGYGIIRLGSYLRVEWSGLFYDILIVVALWGGMLTSFMCLRQADMKALVAYSSVGHMRLVLGGCLSNCRWG